MRILLIDDDPLIGIAIQTIVEQEKDIEVCAIGTHFDDAIHLYEEHLPDLCLFDIQIGEKTGLDAAEVIKKAHPNARFLFLTTFLDEEYIKNALTLGAGGYILKQDVHSIVPAVRTVTSGQSVFGDQVMEKIPHLGEKKKDLQQLGLTEKEIEVFECIAEGLNNKEIAQRLYLSEGTVRNYISRLLEKLEVRDRTQLAIYYYK